MPIASAAAAEAAFNAPVIVGALPGGAGFRMDAVHHHMNMMVVGIALGDMESLI